MYACVHCLKPAKFACGACVRGGGKFSCPRTAYYCGSECQSAHWKLVHSAEHAYNSDFAAVGGAIEAVTHPACTKTHKTTKYHRTRDSFELSRLLGDTLVHLRERLKDVAVVYATTPELRPGSKKFKRDEIRAGIYASANVPRLIEESEARASAIAHPPETAAAAAAAESAGQSLPTLPVPTMIFFQNPKSLMSKEKTAGEEKWIAAHNKAVDEFINLLEDDDKTADQVLAEAKPMVPELADVYKIHLNPRQQYILGVVRRLLNDDGFAKTYDKFKVRTDPSCAASDEDGEAIPPIVIYCLTPGSAPKVRSILLAKKTLILPFFSNQVLSEIVRIFADVAPRSKTLMSYKTPPRYSAKIDPLIWWANGDGDAKRALEERIGSDETFAVVRDALYTDDMSAFRGYELDLSAKEEETGKTKKSRAKTKK